MAEPRTAAPTGDGETPSDADRIRFVVASVPTGSVATYGDVALWAGLPRRARLVGRVLASLPPGSRLPWHRVVAAGGRIALRGGSGPGEQRRRLEAEGVPFRGERVDLAHCRWRPDGTPAP